MEKQPPFIVSWPGTAEGEEEDSDAGDSDSDDVENIPVCWTRPENLTQTKRLMIN